MVEKNILLQCTKTLTLLYVEDDPASREMTAMIFQNFFHKVIIAANGAEGLEKFHSNKIDIVITDVNMPQMNGLEMSKEIRREDNDIPLLILSAYNDEKYLLESIAIGVNGYIFKPLDVEQLMQTIWRVIQKYRYIHESKENLFLLQEYQKATNESSIVSKTDTKGIITYVNDAFCKISGYTREELIGKNHNIVRHPDNPKSLYKEIWHTIKDEKKIWKGVVRNRAKDGKSYYVDSIIMPVLNLEGEILEYISLRNDITHIMNPLKQLKEELMSAAAPLLILLKLEDFQDIEDLYDTETIAEIEDAAGSYLHKKLSAMYDYDKLYRLENGEYALVLDAKRHKNREALISQLKVCQKEIQKEKIHLREIEYNISVIISVVFEKEKIFESAKLGMKRLMQSKKNFIIADNLARIEQENAKKNMKTISMIRSAIESSRIISYFQPIIDNASRKIVKYESLVRLINEKNEVVSPFFFLETAKRSKYYLEITKIVLEHSFSILQKCDADISINLSALDIEQIDMRQKIFELLQEHKKDAHRIVFELLEDEKIKDFQLVKTFICNVKAYGVKIAIDDFGAGYSNYERLLDYQPDILKIDGCLIRDIETSSYSLSAVKSIVTFAKEQNLQTIAEFIENEKIFQIVKELGVDFSQGYYFGKPGPL